MIVKKGNYLENIGGYVSTITPEGEIILQFRARGTCFPAREDGYTTRSCFLHLVSYDGMQNKVFIDYSDGTGWHEYIFRKNGSRYEIVFRTTEATDPNEIAYSPSDIYVSPNDGKGGGEFGIHFFQDLADTQKINTVDHTYPQEREVFVKFENPNTINEFKMRNIVLLGSFPSLARLRNLKILYLDYLLSLNDFENEAVQTLLEEVTLSDIGINVNSVPLWIKNSLVRILGLNSYISLPNAAAFESEIINPFKATLENLSLSGVELNYKLPESFSELSQLRAFTIKNNVAADDFEFPDNFELEDFNYLVTTDRRVPLYQLKRFIQEVPTINKTLSCRRAGNTTTAIDLVLDSDDFSMMYFDGSYSRWNNGAPPTCVGQMKNLKRLTIYGSYNYATSSGASSLTNWGDFRGARLLEQINFYWQQKMDLTLPAWLSDLTLLKILNVHSSFETQQSMDDFVDSVYSFVIANASITQGNTSFRQMNIITYGSARPLNSWRPTGTLQEPAGYVQGSSNGTPATPMEKIYVLTNQYEHSWILKP